MYNPQMFPLNWIFLYFMFMVIFYYLMSLLTNFISFTKKDTKIIKEFEISGLTKKLWDKCW